MHHYFEYTLGRFCAVAAKPNHLCWGYFSLFCSYKTFTVDGIEPNLRLSYSRFGGLCPIHWQCLINVCNANKDRFGVHASESRDETLNWGNLDTSLQSDSVAVIKRQSNILKCQVRRHEGRRRWRCLCRRECNREKFRDGFFSCWRCITPPFNTKPRPEHRHNTKAKRGSGVVCGDITIHHLFFCHSFKCPNVLFNINDV